MGRKKKNGKKRKRDEEEDVDIVSAPMVSPEAIRGVSAVFFLAVAGFLILANFGIGGTAGAFLYEKLSWLFGIGYMLLPLSLILAGIAGLRSFEKHFGLIQLVSVCVFLLSALGMVNLAFQGKGGVIGAGISTHLVAVVDTVATVIFLLAFTVASLIVAFDIHLGSVISSIREYFRRKEDDDEEDVSVVGLPEEDAGASEDTEDEEEAADEPIEEDGGSGEKANVK